MCAHTRYCWLHIYTDRTVSITLVLLYVPAHNRSVTQECALPFCIHPRYPSVQTSLNSYRTSPLSKRYSYPFPGHDSTPSPPLIWQFRIGKVSLEARTRKFCGRKKLLRHGREGGGWWPWGWGPEPAVAVVKLKNVLGFLPLSQLEKIGQELRHLCHDQIDRSRDSCCPLLRTL